MEGYLKSEHENCHVEPVEKPLDENALAQAEAAFLGVSGRGCPNCSMWVRIGLLNLRGVLYVEVYLQNGVAAVAYDPQQITAKSLITAVFESGNDGRHEYRFDESLDSVLHYGVYNNIVANYRDLERIMKLQGLSAGKLAKAAVVNVETLRYYERRGLLPEPPRKESGYRVYPETAVERLRFIKGAQVLGFTLEEIQELLDLRVDEHAHRAEVRQRAQEKAEDIERKIRALEAMRDALHDLIEQCHGDGPIADCPILEAMPHASLGLHPEPER